MGYTHYFESIEDIKDSDWENICKDFRKVLKNTDFVGGGSDGELPKSKIIDKEEDIIIFNGLGEDSYETMLISKEKEGFNFCKTSRNPYDLIVCSLLLIVNDRAPYAVKISSDGSVADWVESHKFTTEILKRPLLLPSKIKVLDDWDSLKVYEDQNELFKKVSKSKINKPTIR